MLDARDNSLIAEARRTQSCAELLSIDTNDRVSLRTSAFRALPTGTRRPLATSTREVAKPHLLEIISGPSRCPRLRGIGPFCWAATLTPTLSRKREREYCKILLLRAGELGEGLDLPHQFFIMRQRMGVAARL